MHEKLKAALEEAGLTSEHWYEGREDDGLTFWGITRAGIEILEDYHQITVHLYPAKCEPDFAVVNADASMGEGDDEKTMTTLATCEKATNNMNTHYAEIAENRARSRVVLKILGLYRFNAYGEDERPDKPGALKRLDQEQAPKPKTDAKDKPNKRTSNKYMKLIEKAETIDNLLGIHALIKELEWPDKLEKDLLSAMTNRKDEINKEKEGTDG